jgi:hypothetical protein
MLVKGHPYQLGPLSSDALVPPLYYAVCYRLTVILPFMWGCISQW